MLKLAVLCSANEFTVTALDPQDPAVTQPPSPLIKYVVLDPGVTTKEFTVVVVNSVTPQLVVYTCQAVASFKLPVQFKVVLSPLQMMFVPVIPVGTVDKVLTVIGVLTQAVVLHPLYLT